MAKQLDIKVFDHRNDMVYVEAIDIPGLSSFIHITIAEHEGGVASVALTRAQAQQIADFINAR